jgi:hypothetical protein
MVEHTMINAQKSWRRSTTIRGPFLDMLDLKKKRVIHFEGRLASGPEEICDLFYATNIFR